MCGGGGGVYTHLVVVCGSRCFRSTVNYLTFGRRKACDSLLAKLKRRKGKQMRAWMVGMAVVVAVGLIWSVAAMSKWVPVQSAEMGLAATSRAAEQRATWADEKMRAPRND